MTKPDPDQRDIFDKQPLQYPFTKTSGGGAAPLSSSELSSPSETCYNLVKRAFKVSKLMTVIVLFVLKCHNLLLNSLSQKMHGNEDCPEGDVSGGLESLSNNPATSKQSEQGNGSDVISENISNHSGNGSGMFPWLNLSGLERFAIAARLGSQRRRGSGSLVLRYTLNNAIVLILLCCKR